MRHRYPYEVCLPRAVHFAKQAPKMRLGSVGGNAKQGSGLAEAMALKQDVKETTFRGRQAECLRKSAGRGLPCGHVRDEQDGHPSFGPEQLVRRAQRRREHGVWPPTGATPHRQHVALAAKVSSSNDGMQNAPELIVVLIGTGKQVAFTVQAEPILLREDPVRHGIDEHDLAIRAGDHDPNFQPIEALLGGTPAKIGTSQLTVDLERALGRRMAFSWKRANPVGSFKLLSSHTELWGLSAANFLGQFAHQVLPAVFVLYAGHRYGWGERLD